MIDPKVTSKIVAMFENSDDYAIMSPSASLKDDDIVVFRNVQTGAIRVAEVGSVPDNRFFRSLVWEKYGVFRAKPKQTPEPVEVGTIARFIDKKAMTPYFVIKTRGGGGSVPCWEHLTIEPGSSTIPYDINRYHSWNNLVNRYGNPSLVNPYRPSQVREDGTY